MENNKLSNGAEMPLEGFGVFQVPDPAVCKKAVLDAIRTGYRLIDTAQVYMNEAAVGEAVREAIAEGLVKREDLFITTKLWVSDFSHEGAKEDFRRSMQRLGLEYLYLLHQPFGDSYGPGWPSRNSTTKDSSAPSESLTSIPASSPSLPNW